MSDAKFTLPDAEALAKASDMDVLDSTGSTVRFGSLFESEKVVVVFIRHFFCGVCQDYVRELATVRKEALEEAGTQIVVIGCGDWQPIPNYIENTNFQGRILANPTRDLYRALGMTIESLAGMPAGEAKPSYVKTGAMARIFGSIWKGPVQNPLLIGKQGNISQLGGDFIFGPGNECSFASRMQNTEDHVAVANLMKAAGVAYP